MIRGMLREPLVDLAIGWAVPLLIVFTFPIARYFGMEVGSAFGVAVVVAFIVPSIIAVIYRKRLNTKIKRQQAEIDEAQNSQN